MFKRVAFACLLLASIGGTAVARPDGMAATPRQPAPLQRAAELETGQIIARPWPESIAKAQAMLETLAAQGVRIVREVRGTDEWLIASGVNGTQALSAQLRDTGLFEYVHPDARVYPASTPDDSLYPEQWHHRVLRSELAWSINTGAPSTVVAVVDTGIDLDHPDLIGRRVLGWRTIGTAVQQASLADPLISDIFGHGTAIAGIVAAVGNNAAGVTGLGWDMRVMPVRVSTSLDGGALLSDVLLGARTAAEQGVKFVSVSYSGVEFPAVKATGDYLATLDASLFFAAGNLGNTLDPDLDWANVFVVGATDQNDITPPFSVRGAMVDLTAPGVGVLTCEVGGNYTFFTGTSFSTPMVAAAAALAWTANPTLTRTQWEQVLRTTAVDLGPPGDDPENGDGRLDLFSVLAAATGQSALPRAQADAVLALSGEGTVLDVLANDGDPGRGPLSITAFASSSLAGGSVTTTTGPGGRPALLYTPPAGLSSGSDQFSYTITNSAGNTATATVNVSVQPAGDYAIGLGEPSTIPGLKAVFYDLPPGTTSLPNLELLQPGPTETLAWINNPAPFGPYAVVGRSQNAGVSITGLFRAERTGSYRFVLQADDGARLTVSGVPVIERPGLGLETSEGVVRLRAGQHTLHLEHFQADGESALVLSVQRPGLPLTEAPSALFSQLRQLADIVGIGGAPPGDGLLTGDDFVAFVAAFAADDPLADLTGIGGGSPDGLVTGDDFIAFINAFAGGS